MALVTVLNQSFIALVLTASHSFKKIFHKAMHAKHEVKIFISLMIMSNMIDLIMCGNKRIKIYVPEHIKHVHHHHVKKVPVYIVTKEKPRVMHASHIEDDFEDSSYRKLPRTKTHPDYDDISIQGIYKGDESHVHEDIDMNLEYTTLEPQIEMKKQKVPYTLRNSNYMMQNYLLQRPGVRLNRLKLYD